MKLGLQINRFTWPGGDAEIGPTLERIVRKADEVGFDSLWVMDHFFQIRGIGPAEEPMLEGMTTLGFMAAHTKRARLGLMVGGVHYRQPALWVKATTTLDVLSGGRAWLGIGAAWNEDESRSLGFPFPPLGDRFELLEETLQMAHAMWTGEHGTEGELHGRLTHATRLLNSPQSLSRPRVPIMIGGGGEKKTLRLVAQYADACNVFGSPEAIARKYAILAEHCADVGRDPAEIEHSTLQNLWVSADGHDRTETPQQIVDRFGELSDAGADYVIASMPNVTDPDAIELVGREVIRPFVAYDDGMTDNPFGGLSISIIDSPAGAGAEAVARPGGPSSDTGGDGIVETKVVIIGSGPAGLTAAIYAARANLEPVVLAGSAPGGQLMLTSDVENYPGFVEGIQGPELMAAFRAQAERFGTRIVDVDIDRVDFSERPFRIWARGIEYRAQSVIVATGASALWLGLDSETRLRGRGVSACATCDGFFFRDREIAVVGGGDTAFEEATFLTRFATKVHLFHRRDTFKASKIMVDRAKAHPKIEIHTNTAVEEVLGEAKVDGLRLRDTVTEAESTMAIEGLFIAIGYRPNTDAFRDWLEVDEAGYLVVRDETGSKIDGVFIAGDVHDHRYRQAVTAAADGCKAAIDAERWLESQGITEAATATAW